MSTIGSKISKICLLAGKAETTTGAVESVTSDDAGLIVRNPQMQRTEETNDRELPAALGQDKSEPGGDQGTLTFQTELAGSGSDESPVPAWASLLLPPCNYTESSGVFAYTRGEVTNTFVLYEDGLKKTLFGSRGTFKITAEKGKPAVIDWTFTGKYTDEADASILTPTFPTVLAPVCKGLTLTIGSFTPRASKVEIDAGNQVILREDLTDATAYFAAAIVDTKPTGTMDPETVAVSSRSWATLRSNSTEEAFSMLIGSVAGNKITIASSTCQTRTNTRGSRNGLMINNIGLQFNGATPLSITFE